MRRFLMASTALCFMASASFAQSAPNVGSALRTATSTAKAVERGNEKAALQQAGSAIRSTTGVRIPTNERQAIRTVQRATGTSAGGSGGYGRAARQAAGSQAWASAASARSQRLAGYAAKNYASTGEERATSSSTRSGTSTSTATTTQPRLTESDAPKTVSTAGGTKTVTPTTQPRLTEASDPRTGTQLSSSTYVPGTEPGTRASVASASGGSRAEQTNAQREKLFNSRLNDYY